MSVIKELEKAVKELIKEKKFVFLIPEVRTNFVYGKENMKDIKDIAGVDGRITIVNNKPHPAGKVKFGASDHLARLLLNVRRYTKKYLSAINFKFDKKILKIVKEVAKKKKIKIGVIDRKREPKRYQSEDKKSMPWKVAYLYKKYQEIPQIFYETAGLGKEPLFVILGERPKEIVSIIKELLKYL
ncbi:MAG: thiamine-phosphate synthase family protein [candidate division WOR-3 bacterium]|nr:thiamine-phosphate synthase family protein [candidate division WOR-3 bacterium]